MSAVTGYTIKTPVYEGPLELLLDLIESRKLLINDISLAAVADDFLAYLKRLPRLPTGEVAHFILIASTLLLIKSKSLLPSLPLSEDEAGNIEDLERRLSLYREIRQLSRHILERYGARLMWEPAHRGLSEEPYFAPGKSLANQNLTAAVERVLATIPADAKLPEAVVREVVSIEEMIDRLAERVKKELETSFREFAGVGKAEKVEVIVSFLALLELVKQGMVAVTQAAHFGDIAIAHEKVGTPGY